MIKINPFKCARPLCTYRSKSFFNVIGAVNWVPDGIYCQYHVPIGPLCLYRKHVVIEKHGRVQRMIIPGRWHELDIAVECAVIQLSRVYS